jgi:hypothetical protein
MDDNDDGFDRRWDYRVFSEQWTCPDDWNRGQRYLTIHHVDYNNYRCFDGTHDYPLDHDLLYIEAEPASPSGIGMEEIMLDADRIQKAFDHPVMIKAEWQRYFDHSEQQNRLNAKRHREFARQAREHAGAAKQKKEALP